MDAVTIFQSQISKVNFQVEKGSVETRVSRGFGEGINGNKLILKKKGFYFLLDTRSCSIVFNDWALSALQPFSPFQI